MQSLAGIAAWVLLLAVPGPARAQALLARPTGPHRVGTFRVSLVDSTRVELSHADRADPRRLSVQVWYPASPTSDTPLAPYIPEFGPLERDLREAYPTLDLEPLKTWAYWEAAPEPGRRYPLVVFSHGMNSARFFYTGLVEDLASHGFVVAAIDHPFWSLAGWFPENGHLPLAETMASRDWLTSEQIDGFMQDGVAVMAADQAFVATRLSSADPRLRSVLDRRWTGVMGHSMGGMAATSACWTYRVFAACVSLDGLVWAQEGFTPIGEPPNRVAKPFLLLLSPQFLPPDLSTVVRRYHRAWRDPSLCLLSGSRHNSFSDLPQLRGTAPGPGELDPARAAELSQRAVVGFFLSTLADRRPAHPFPGDSMMRPLPGDSTPGCHSTGA